ncbi:MAG: hypothetical protein ACP5NX_02075 [Candidatus Bilamarchaeaceae archaeon]
MAENAPKIMKGAQQADNAPKMGGVGEHGTEKQRLTFFQKAALLVAVPLCLGGAAALNGCGTGGNNTGRPDGDIENLAEAEGAEQDSEIDRSCLSGRYTIQLKAGMSYAFFNDAYETMNFDGINRTDGGNTAAFSGISMLGGRHDVSFELQEGVEADLADYYHNAENISIYRDYHTLATPLNLDPDKQSGELSVCRGDMKPICQVDAAISTNSEELDFGRRMNHGPVGKQTLEVKKITKTQDAAEGCYIPEEQDLDPDMELKTTFTPGIGYGPDDRKANLADPVVIKFPDGELSPDYFMTLSITDGSVILGEGISDYTIDEKASFYTVNGRWLVKASLIGSDSDGAYVKLSMFDLSLPQYPVSAVVLHEGEHGTLRGTEHSVGVTDYIEIWAGTIDADGKKAVVKELGATVEISPALVRYDYKVEVETSEGIRYHKPTSMEFSGDEYDITLDQADGRLNGISIGPKEK